MRTLARCTTVVAALLVCASEYAEASRLVAYDAGSTAAGDTFISIDGETGVGSAIALEHVNRTAIAGLDYDPGLNSIYGSTMGGSRLVRVDVATGNMTDVGPIGFEQVQGLAFDPVSRILYGSDITSNRLLNIDLSTGGGTAVGEFGFTNVHGLAFDPVRMLLFGTSTNQTPRETTLIVIDTATGRGSSVGLVRGGGAMQIEGLAFDVESGLLFGTDRANDSLFTIDPATAAASLRGPIGFSSVFGLSLAPPSPVPLPAAAWLMFSGLGAMGLLARRRSRQDRSD